MADLTRADWVKTRLHLVSGDTNFNTYDSLIDRIISEVSEAVQTYCDRDFEQQDYNLWVNGTGRRHISLPVAPITAVYCARQCPANAITVTGPTHSQVAVVAGVSVLLRTISSGTWSTTTIDLTSDTTLGAVATAIDAESGWSTANVVDSTIPSAWLQPLSNASAENGVDLQYPSEAIPTTQTAGGNRYLYSDSRHGDYVGFDYGRRNVYVQCQAGYTLPTESPDVTGTLPTDLVGIVHDLIEEVFRGLIAAQDLVDVTGDAASGGPGATLTSLRIDDYAEGYSTAGGAGSSGGTFSTSRLSEGINGAVAKRAGQLSAWRLIRLAPSVSRSAPVRIV